MAAPGQPQQPGPAQAPPQQVTEQEGPPSIGRVSVAGEVILIRIVALIYGVIALLIIILGLTSFDFSTRVIIGIVILGIGFLLSVVGVMLGTIKLSENPAIPSLNAILIILAVLLFIAGIIIIVYGNKSYMDMREMSILNLAVIILATIFILAYIESMHAVLRFTEIAEYAASHGLVEFSVKPVVFNYLIWSFILYVGIFICTGLVLGLDILLKLMISPFSPQFIDSIIMNSAYSLAITMFIVFLPIVVILTFIFASSKKTVKADMAAREDEFDMVK